MKKQRSQRTINKNYELKDCLQCKQSFFYMMLCNVVTKKERESSRFGLSRLCYNDKQRMVLEISHMYRLKNVTIKLAIAVLLVASFRGQVVSALSINNQNIKTDGDVKSSIDELVNVQQYLFLSTDKPHIEAPVSYLINATTGQVLYDDDGDYEMDILSVSKILSAYVILDEMKRQEQKYNWETRIKATGNIVAISYDVNFSNIELVEDEEYTLRELFEAMMIKSSNAATMLIGREFFGDEKRFVEATRKKAEELNLKHTTMITSTGLNKDDLSSYGYGNLEDGNNRMTAEDVSFLTMKIIAEYPDILAVTSKPRSTFGNLTNEVIDYETTNWLLPGFEHGYEGVTGFKTGADLMEFTSNVVFTAERNGVRLIGVILGAKNAKVRSEGAITLLEYGFNLLDHKAVVTQDSMLFETGTVNMKYASRNKLPVTVAQDLVLSTSYDELTPQYMFVPTNKKYNPKYDAFEGAVKKGEVLGYITVNYQDLAFLTDGSREHYSVDVIAARDVGNGFFLFNFIEWIADSIMN